MYELEKQVGPLEKQSETARIYLKHRDTLKQYDANMYLIVFYQLKKDSAAIDEKGYCQYTAEGFPGEF